MVLYAGADEGEIGGIPVIWQRT